ncbi:MAG: LptF/LptG family permease [Campylobacterales bacterium]|nr:LptF/LptG family permease [Campylobacterales bacterium]
MISNFGGVFFPIFFSFYTIASILIFLQISAKTTIIKMSFFEMIQFYFFSVPEILLYTFPITFFVSAIITLAKMSFDLELIVVFTLQATVKEILKPFIYLAILVSVTTLIMGFWIKPQTLYKTKEFIYLKQKNAQVNIKPSEFGQNFGSWLLFVKDKKDERDFKDIVLLSIDPNNKTFISAGEANFLNSDGEFRLKLKEGNAYNFLDDEIEQIQFQDMSLNESPSIDGLKFPGVIEYWKDTSPFKIAFTFLTAIFPLLSILMIISLGIFNPRYEKNRSVPYSITAILIYFVLAENFAKTYEMAAIIPIVWLGVSYGLYYFRIRKIY